MEAINNNIKFINKLDLSMSMINDSDVHATIVYVTHIGQGLDHRRHHLSCKVGIN
jgi:hypothetical protein